MKDLSKLAIALYFMILLSTGAFAALDDGLVGYWNMDLSSDNTAVDKAGYNDNGTIYGAKRTSGNVDSGLKLDGLNDYVRKADSARLSVDHFTVSAWVKFQGLNDGSNDRVVYKLADEGTNRDNYALGVDDSGQPYIDLEQASDGNDIYVTSPETISEDEWIHISGTFNGDNMSIYVNGKLKKSKTSVKLPYTGSNGHFLIGSRQGDNGGMGEESYFNGSVDQVRVYKRALSTSEVKKIYNNETGICNFRGPKNQCIMNETVQLDPKTYSIDSIFISEKFASIESFSGQAILDVGNSTFISGLWHGSFYLNTSDLVIKPGGSFKPENGGITLGR